MISATKLYKTYSTGSTSYEALKAVDLTIETSESLAILGRSGSGKSTLMHLLAGLDRPTSGAIVYDRQALSSLSEAAIARFRNRHVGFIFQQFFLQPTMTVLDNVVLPMKVAGAGPKQRTNRALEVLKKVGLADKAHNKATDLSGGQKQRVAVARALVMKPEIIFADEPTGNLDSETANQIMSLLLGLHKEEGVALIVVTHDTEVAGLCGRQIHIKDGVII